MSVAAGQQLSAQTALANYVVKGNIDLPEGGTAAPPQGIVMQFPGAQVALMLILALKVTLWFENCFQEAAEENDEDDDEKVPQAAQQSEEELKRKVRFDIIFVSNEVEPSAHLLYVHLYRPTL